MSVKIKDGRAVHFPANPDRFEFDAEVSEVFPDIANRSIPLYAATHDLHAGVAYSRFKDRETIRVLDVGASRGAFIRSINRAFDAGDCLPYIVASDFSPHMVSYLKQDFGNCAEIRQTDLCSDEFLSSEETFDVINCTYVLQFLPVHKQVAVLRKMISMLNPEGILFLGQKEGDTGDSSTLYDLLHQEYIKFRVANGYSIEEIQAKTAALKKAMKPMPKEALALYLKNLGMRTHESSRWSVFYNLICIKE